MRKWNTTVTVTDSQGRTGTATTPVCDDDEQSAATGIVGKLRDQGYQTSHIVVTPAGNCDHQH